MAGQSSAMIGWSWTDVSVLGSQVFGQALMDSCVHQQWGMLRNVWDSRDMEALKI